MAMNEELEKLHKLQEKYMRLRNEKLATEVVIKSVCGSFEVTNPQVIMKVLDFLIREVGEQIKQYINE